jgi:hypothetical protein
MDGVLEQSRAVAHRKEVTYPHVGKSVAFAPEFALGGRSAIADPTRLVC